MYMMFVAEALNLLLWRSLFYIALWTYIIKELVHIPEEGFRPGAFI